MARRDAAFDAATNLAIVGPLTPEALARLPGRFEAWAGSSSGAPFRFRRGGQGWVAVAASAARASVVRVSDDLDLAGVEALARRLEYTEFGAILILTPTFGAVSFSHYFGDGPATLGPLRAILSGVETAQPRTTRVPLVRALLTTRQWRPSALRAGRALLHTMHGHFSTASWSAPGQQTDAATVALSTVAIDSSRLRARTAVERAGDASGRTISTLDVLTSLILRAFATSLADGTDMPVRMLVGLRQFLPDELSTRGNFSTSAILGTLRGRDWSPAAVGDVMGPMTSSPTLLASAVVEGLAHARASLRARTPGGASSPLLLTYNVLTGRVGVDRGDFIPGAQQQSTLFMLNRGPVLGPHCTVTATGADFLVTTVDDTGLIDLDAFERALEAALG